MCMERKKILAQEPKNQYDQKKTWNSKSSIANFSRKKQGLYAQEKAIVHVKSLLNNTFVTLTTLDGWMFLLVQSISETCTRPSTPSSISTKQP